MIALAFLMAAIVAPPTQAVLDSLAFECGLTAGELVWNPQSKSVGITSTAELDPALKQLTCLLPKLNEAGFPFRLGFISEPPAPNESK